MTTPGRPYPPLQPERPPGRSGRTLLIAAAVFFVLLIVAVVIPLVLVGTHNNGVKPPPGPVQTHSVPVSTP